MPGKDREPGVERTEDADALEHLLREGVEAEISAAREALEEARRLLEGALRRTEEAFEEAPGMIPAAEAAGEEP